MPKSTGYNSFTIPLLLLRHIVNNNLQHISVKLSDFNFLFLRRIGGVQFVYP